MLCGRTVLSTGALALATVAAAAAPKALTDEDAEASKTAGDAADGSATLVDILQPVGRSKVDGRYFACAEFRKLGTAPAFYSTAYWLDPKTKLVTAGSATPSTNAPAGGSKAATEPHCDIGGIAFDIVD